MDEHKLEEAFRNLKQQIPVNEVLKKNLRKEFVRPQRPRRARRLLAEVAVAAVFLVGVLTYMLTPESFIEQASAASMKIANHISFVELGVGENKGVAEHQGKIYIPLADRGLFIYDDSGLNKLIDKEVDYVRVSPDGGKLVLAANGSVSIYEVGDGSEEVLLKGDGKSVYYEQPSWSPKGDKIIFTKKIIEGDEKNYDSLAVKEAGVYEIDLKTKETVSIAEGTYGSYVPGTDSIILEQGDKIIIKNSKDGFERVIDDGRSPSVSPDGNYVVYVKARQMSEGVAEDETGEKANNLWIADTGDKPTKRRITSNEGQFNYYEPVWGSDSASIYLLKSRRTEVSEGEMRLARIDLTGDKLTAEETVKRFIQALVVRDDDYAKTLMKNPPSSMTMSNPRYVGYKIVAAGTDQGREYVEAEMNSAYTANPYYTVAKVRFLLSPSENGFIIDEVVPLEDVSVMEKNNGQVFLSRGEKTELLFTEDEVPAKFVPEGAYRFGSMAYNNSENSLVFTIQAMQNENQKAYLELISYDLKEKSFKRIDKITKLDNYINVGVSNLVLDSSGKFAALDLFSTDGSAFTSDVFIYDLSKDSKVSLSKTFSSTKVDSVHTTYWDAGKLIFSLSSDGQNMGYIYRPERGISSF